jgi:hypothetical protein
MDELELEKLEKFNFTLDIVVSKYKENLSWVDPYMGVIFPAKIRKFIYSKFENEDGPYIKLPNVGNESHTYLHHIVNYYDDLSDYVLFSQGNPLDHTPHFDADLLNIPFFDFFPIGIERHVDDINGYPNGYVVVNGKTRNDHCYGNFYKDIFGSDAIPPKRFIYVVGAIFSVKREVIRHYPIEFYINIINLMNKYDKFNYKWVTWGHFMERMWTQIFNIKKEIL